MFELRPYDRNHTLNYNPFREMDEFENRFFTNPFSLFGNDSLAQFRTDITDNGDSYLLEADLPGFDKKDIKLNINGDTLTVSAERRSKTEEKDNKGKCIRCERSYGSYSRQFDVSGVETSGIKAKYEDGVLKLTMPKKAELPEQSHRLEIE